MKNNLLFLVVLISLLIIGLGALFYVYRFEDSSTDLETATQEVIITTDEDLTDQNSQEDNYQEEINQQLNAQPEVSQDDSLETIQQELENTVIFEENFGDL